MSEPWSQLSDVDRLADRQAEVAFEKDDAARLARFGTT